MSLPPSSLSNNHTGNCFPTTHNVHCDEEDGNKWIIVFGIISFVVLLLCVINRCLHRASAPSLLNQPLISQQPAP